MTMQQYIGTSSSSSSSLMASLKKYDVFISFRGEDTRKAFTSHLNEALCKKVLTFIDDTELERGDEILPTLIKAIEESEASVVIFSKDYASSTWCLNELVKILECKRDQGQIVIPIFYEVEPSHVRNQTGSYGQAFEKHERNLRHSKDKSQKWKDALTEASNLSGWNSKDYGKESDFIKDIVKDVLKKLNHRHPLEDNKELVGIEEKYEEVKSLLDLWSNDVRIVTLWGMGGIGKTTLAKYLYAKLCSQFDRHCNVENIREESARCGLNNVRRKLFSTLLELGPDALHVETPIFMRRLALERSLVVLDDVATLELAQNVNIVRCLGPGSTVIITTRDKQICSQFGDCQIYEVEGLNEDESLQLFCLNAFGEERPKNGYEYLSKKAILYCKGNPLALEVLGSNFCKKESKAWESDLEKLKQIPNRRIHDVLKLSFDDLDSAQQEIFLDIACTTSIETTTIYYSGYSDDDEIDSKLFAESELRVLQNKSLIYLDDYENGFGMHDLLAEMGKEIVKKESAKNPGKRSRLWDPKEVSDVLKYNQASHAVEVIHFHISKPEDLYLRSDSFKSMTNLRYLRINMDSRSRLYLLEGLEWLSDKLRYLFWLSFPLESLPSTFCAEWLVQLRMPCTKLKKLWDGIQRLDNLMLLDLEDSIDLIEIPDLSRAPNLELVFLSGCESLRQIHPYIFSIPKLRQLRLENCKKIKSVKTNIHSKSLKILLLGYCSSLVDFSVTSEEMTTLSLMGTNVHEFPSSIWRNSKLIDLYLDDCKNLNIVGKKLPNDSGLGSLTVLGLSGCTQINTSNLWVILDGTPSLKTLNMRKCCNLEILPDNIQSNSMLETLDLGECSKLMSIPKLPPFLETLQLDECRKLKSLPKLPASLLNLDAKNCIYLDNNSILQLLVKNMLHRYRTNTKWHRINTKWHGSDFTFLPGAQFPSEFEFCTTGASLVIPPIPKYGLCCLVYCIILSGDIKGISHTIYENARYIDIYHLPAAYEKGTLLSDHVLICPWSPDYRFVKMGSENGGDHYNLSFEFKLDESREKVMSTKAIKGCGVIPIYGKSRSRVEIVELQPNAQLSDDSDQHSRSSTDENEDEKQQLLILPKKRKRS